MAVKADEQNLREAQKDRNIKRFPNPGKYPTNHVTRSPGGIVRIECDDPENTTVAEFHPGGYYRIVHPDGSIVETTVGESKFEYGSQTVTMRHNMSFNAGGKLQMQVEGGAHITTAGDLAITAGKTGTINILGDAAIAVNGNAHISAKKNLNIDAEGDMKIKAKGELNLGSDGGMKIQSTSIAMQHAGDGAPGYRA
jgi:hypothetical protein